MMLSGKYDAVIIGSGPNGLASAIELQQNGLTTLVLEQASSPGGAVRTGELTLPGYKHDYGSAIHPLAIASPFLKSLPLESFGLKWVESGIPFAHPFEDGSAYAALRDIKATADILGRERFKYLSLFQPLLDDWNDVLPDILGPLRWPVHPVKMARFGFKAFMSARMLANLYFSEDRTRTFFFGAAAHSTLPLNSTASAAFGLVLFLLAHSVGWPFPEGGAGNITKAMAGYYNSIGGEIRTSQKVHDLKGIPDTKVYLLDLTPRQILLLEGIKFPWLYRKRLEAYRYGPGVFKLDYALSDPIPFRNQLCQNAGTVHLGFTKQEIKKAEKVIHQGKVPEQPYIILAQHSLFDPSRTPAGKHTAWAYCHVPHGNLTDMTGRIEAQIEKAAPGFRDCIINRKTQNTRQMESWNPNLIGGDINGGRQDIFQLFSRPVTRISPYSTPDPRVYICSSSTPPGGGVHGMCGYHAARKVMKDHFGFMDRL